MSEVYLSQPRNGTSYEFYVEHITDPKIARKLYINVGGWFIAWVNHGCCAFQTTGYLDLYGIMGAYGVNDADGIAIMQFISFITGMSVKNPWPKCAKCGMPMDPRYDIPFCVTCELSHNQAIDRIMDELRGEVGGCY